MDLTRRLALAVGLLVFLWTTVVYFLTLTPTVPFWDSGEFIAVSYILGIPHPPGTPFYVLLGRIATLVPWASVAERVNGMSALAAALAVLLTYFTGLRLIRLAQGPERGRTHEVIAVIGAFTGAMLLAFSDSFWENSIEAEVYALMSLAQILALWLGLKWWEAHERKPTVGHLLVAVYVMWLCVGLHLGVGIMGLPLMVLAWFVDRRIAQVFALPFLSVLFVTMGLERLAGVMLGLAALVFLMYAWQRKLKAAVAGIGALGSVICMIVAFGDAPITPGLAVIAVLSVVVPMLLLARGCREGRILALAFLLMIVGYSTHLYLPIRAAQHPAINEGDPSNWERMRDLLERKQYGESSMFVRRAGGGSFAEVVAIQLDKEFWRYFRRQWPLFPTDRLWGSLLPLLLGLAGAAWQARRERASFLTMFCFVGLTTVGLIAFLNFSHQEVRERDYFFQSGYHAYAIWIGMGAAWLLHWVHDSFSGAGARRAAFLGCGALMALQPVLLLRNMWFTHDRRGLQLARDYAHNMLAPLEPNSFVVTNGDNDTFPLWYLQEVEGFRKDVRVVNLSLLNTDWYIFQLRDQEPKLPITLDDETIRMAGQGAFQDAQGNIIYTNRFMIDHILQQNRTVEGGWKKQPYFAVTVPEQMNLEKSMTLEGLVYKVYRDTLRGDVNEAKTRAALYDTFRYRGLFRADGAWDSTVYKDENASTLSRNYAAAHVQLAFLYEQRGEVDRAIAELERVERMFPGYMDVLVPLGKMYMDHGDTAAALRLFERLIARMPRSSEAQYYYGVTLMFQRDYGRALAAFDRAIELDRGNFYPYVAAYSMLFETGQREQGLTYLERWSNDHPEDQETRALLDAYRQGALPDTGLARLPRR